jgi:hypothetical protein
MWQVKTIIEQLKKCLDESSTMMVSGNVYGDANWTEQLKKALGRVGRQNGFKVCGSTKEQEFEREWLYDLVWYKEDEQGFLIEAPLTVESEWKKDLIKDIKFDFEKLLLSRSNLKLMICNCQNQQIGTFVDYFQKAINVCPFVPLGDSFLIAILKLKGIEAVRFEYFEMTKIALDT